MVLAGGFEIVVDMERPGFRVEARMEHLNRAARPNSFRRHLGLFLSGGVLLLASPIAPTRASESLPECRRATFGPAKDIAELDVRNNCGSVSTDSKGVRTKTLDFSAALSRCLIYPAQDGFEYLAVGHLQSAMLPGEPELPMETFVLKVERNAHVLGVEVKSGQYREIQEALHLTPHAQVKGANIWKVVADPAEYSLKSYLPGMLVSYDSGRDNQHLSVFIHFFPVQYIPSTKKTVLVERARLELTYTIDTGAQAEPLSRRGALAKAKCVVVCPRHFESSAQRLADFHTAEEKIRSVVATTEWIQETYEPAEDPSFSGYKDSTLPGFQTITNYNYDLARRIIAFLRDSAAHPKLQYVALLGGAAQVPPSYYHFQPFEEEWYGQRAKDGESWTATDLLYSSPDYDLVPNYEIGRLPARNSQEAAHLVEKTIRWHQQADWRWFRNTVVASLGGTEVWRRHRLLDGLEVIELSEANKLMEKQNVEPALNGADVGILIHVGHGSPCHMGLAESIITVNDIMKYQEHDKVPMVFSVGCDTAAFDSSLVPGIADYLKGFRGISLAESVLLSKVGGIAYFGGARFNTRAWSFHTQAGVLGREFYTSQLLLCCLEAYQDGADTLGEILSRAVYQYVSRNDLKRDPYGEKILFQFVLLGDPALKIPAVRHHR
jgi:hypothetical protein